MVELQPSKLNTWVRFPSPAPYLRAGKPDTHNRWAELGVLNVVGQFVQERVLAHIAQSVEHFLGKEEVTGSNPVMSSSFLVVSFVENGVYRRSLCPAMTRETPGAMFSR